MRDTLRLRISPGRESLLYQEIIEVIMWMITMMTTMMVVVVDMVILTISVKIQRDNDDETIGI